MLLAKALREIFPYFLKLVQFGILSVVLVGIGKDISVSKIYEIDINLTYGNMNFSDIKMIIVIPEIFLNELSNASCLQK